jgi:hypothetical protein
MPCTSVVSTGFCPLVLSKLTRFLNLTDAETALLLRRAQGQRSKASAVSKKS